MEFPILFIHSAYMGLKITQLFIFMMFPIYIIGGFDANML